MTDPTPVTPDEELKRLRAALAQAREERDQAIAHDRQPYPTADAYECACKALWHHRERADKAEAAIEGLRRMAQVWIDIRPTKPTVDNGAHVLAYAGQQTLAALDTPEG